MSAAEIIEQIKALPSEDFQQVAQFIDAVRKEDPAHAQVRPGFREAAGEIFDRYDDLFRELAK